MSPDILLSKINGQKVMDPTNFVTKSGKKLYRVETLKMKKKLGGKLIIRKMRVTCREAKQGPNQIEIEK